MSEIRKANSYHAYFITLTVVGWIDVFTRKEYCDEILKNLEYCRAHKGLKVYAYCIMSSHIHLIVSNEDERLPDILRDFKSYTAKQLLQLIKSNISESRREWLLYLFEYFAKTSSQNSEYQFWQKTSHPIELFSHAVFEQKRNYIHQNPVANGLVNDELTFVYSSANPESTFIVDEA
jgi:putative transposase